MIKNENQLKWACRRGMLELDILLGNFLVEAYASTSAELRELFTELVTYEDQDLFEWLTKNKITPLPHLQPIIDAIRQHAANRSHF